MREEEQKEGHIEPQIDRRKRDERPAAQKTSMLAAIVVTEMSREARYDTTTPKSSPEVTSGI
jgi:hypothetical protein